MQRRAALTRETRETRVSVDVEIDGGIKASNASELREAGVDVFVAGSAVFSGDRAKNVREILKAIA